MDLRHKPVFDAIVLLFWFCRSALSLKSTNLRQLPLLVPRRILTTAL